MYREYTPSGVGHFVTAIWYSDSDVDPIEGHVVTPSPYAELVLKVSPSQVETVLSGIMTQQKSYPFMADTHYFGVRFAPTVGATFNAFRLQEILNGSIDLQRFGGTNLVSLAWQLAETADWAAQSRLIETAVKQSPFATQQFASPNVLHALDLIQHRHGQTTIRHLAQEIGLSTRQLERLFLKYVGVTPKTFANIVRLQHVLKLLDTKAVGSLADVALACGFADQAHLANAFRQAMGTSINHYVQSDLLSSVEGITQPKSQKKKALPASP